MVKQTKITSKKSKLPAILSWFKAPVISRKTVKIGQDQTVVNAFSYDLLISVFILSFLINLFILSAWILYQSDPNSRYYIVQLIFN